MNVWQQMSQKLQNAGLPFNPDAAGQDNTGQYPVADAAWNALKTGWKWGSPAAAAFSQAGDSHPQGDLLGQLGHVPGMDQAAIPLWAKLLADKPYSTEAEDLLQAGLENASDTADYESNQINQKLRDMTKAVYQKNRIDMTQAPSEIPMPSGMKLVAPDEGAQYRRTWDLLNPNGEMVNKNWLTIGRDDMGVPSVDLLRGLAEDYKGKGIGREAYQAMAKALGRLRSDSGGATSMMARRNIWQKIGTQIQDPGLNEPRWEISSGSPPSPEEMEYLKTAPIELAKRSQYLTNAEDMANLVDAYANKSFDPAAKIPKFEIDLNSPTEPPEPVKTVADYIANNRRSLRPQATLEVPSEEDLNAKHKFLLPSEAKELHDAYDKTQAMADHVRALPDLTNDEQWKTYKKAHEDLLQHQKDLSEKVQKYFEVNPDSDVLRADGMQFWKDGRIRDLRPGKIITTNDWRMP